MLACFGTYFSTDCRMLFRMLCWRWLTVSKWLSYVALFLNVLLQILQRGVNRSISLDISSSSELDSSGSSVDSIWRAAASPLPKTTRPSICWHRFKWNLSALRTLGKGAVGVGCCRQNCDWYMFLKSDSGISFFKLFFSRNWINVWATLFSSFRDVLRAHQGCLLPRRDML